MRLKPFFQPVHDACVHRTGRRGNVQKAQAGQAPDRFDYSVAFGKPASKPDLVKGFARAIVHDGMLLHDAAQRTRSAIVRASKEIDEASEQYAKGKEEAIESIASSYVGPSNYIDHAFDATQRMRDVLVDFYTGVHQGTQRFENVSFLSAVVIEAADPEKFSNPLKSLHKKFNAVGKVLVEDTKLLNRSWDEATRWRRDFINIHHGADWRSFAMPFTGAKCRQTVAVDSEDTDDLIDLTDVWRNNIDMFLGYISKPRQKRCDGDGEPADKPLRERLADARGTVMALKTRIGKRRSLIAASA